MGLQNRIKSGLVRSTSKRKPASNESSSGDYSSASSGSISSPTPSAKEAKLIAKFMQQHNGKGNTSPPDMTKHFSKMSSKQQLRAYSFLKRNMAAQGVGSSEFLNSTDGKEEGETIQEQQERSIEVLEDNVKRLTEKCEALESQNILVAVQQLDFLARSIAWVLTIVVLYLYWRCTGWGLQNYFQFSDLVQEHLPAYLDYFPFSSYFTIHRQARLGRMLVTMVETLFLAIPYLYNRKTHGSMKRRFEVFAVAFILIGRIKLCRWRESVFVQPDSSEGSSHSSNNGNSKSTIPRFGESCTENGIWEANYEISARFLYLSILRLRGLWTKTAQYLSSRADFVPVSYIRELSKLQDQTQSTPWDQIQKLLPKTLLDRLEHIEETPIASASIGQVHIAYLKKDFSPNAGSDDGTSKRGQKVVIKVQHPHAHTLMTDDFWSLNVLCRIIGWMEPDYSFMEILMREWATEARKELDFRIEAENMVEANAELRSLLPTAKDVIYTTVDGGSKDSSDNISSERTPVQVVVPTPILQDLCDRNVLVMDFCEGCRVDDFAQIEEWGLSRSAIMDGISQAFAHFMYCSTIFNGDPHPGNILVRPGTQQDDKDGFTLILLDWGLAKRLPKQKRVAFCQMVYAAATFDYGLLLDSYKTVGLKMKREDTGQSMEDMRFFLRDMAPREESRKRIKRKMKADKQRYKDRNVKVPMESKAYPGEFFFFIRVNELLHGLGGRYSINLGYLDALKPYAERGLRMSTFYDVSIVAPSKPIETVNTQLQVKLEKLLARMESEESLVGGQVCVLDRNGSTEANVAEGTLGGLRSHIPMTQNAVILGYSCTKAITATLAHLMVQDCFLEYDEPICKRVWPDFCPTADPPKHLAKDLGLSGEEVQRRWQWKRQITLRHLLKHTSGLWSSLPSQMTVKKMANCEDTFASYAYNPNKPHETLLPTSKPGEKTEYHYLSFGWLVAGTLCGAYALKKNRPSGVSFQDVYQDLLEPKLSQRTKEAGFYPTGGHGKHIPAQTVTSDFRASTMMQRRREAAVMGENTGEDESPMMKILADFKGKEFLLDPRIWNCQDVLNANVPAAGGRFSAEGLASFYQDLSHGKLLKSEILIDILSNASKPTSLVNELQGVTRIVANDDSASTNNNNTQMGFGYQRIRTNRDEANKFSCMGHAGVGGSIGFWHVQSGLCVSIMVNKSDGDLEVTKEIISLIANHYRI